jgi:hypothetical protein
MSTLTKLQEVYFDLKDLLNSGEIDDIVLDGFQEFETLREFIEEQIDKIEQVEEDIKEFIR